MGLRRGSWERAASGRLEVGITKLLLWPKYLDVDTFSSAEEMEEATAWTEIRKNFRVSVPFGRASLSEVLMGSCYIPVVWEQPVGLPALGPGLRRRRHGVPRGRRRGRRALRRAVPGHRPGCALPPGARLRPRGATLDFSV